MWRVYVLAALIAAASGSLAAYVTVKLTAPAPRVDRPPMPPATQRLTGEDHLEFPTGDKPTEKIVYYQTPFASPPYLTLTLGGGNAGYMVTDQTEKSFKLQRGPCPVKGKESDWRIGQCLWVAEGPTAK
jgi:hypothetical protein